MRARRLMGSVSLLVLLTVVGCPTPVSTSTSLPGSIVAEDEWTSGGPYGGYIHRLARAASDPDTLFAATDAGIFRSTSGAATWAKMGFPAVEVLAIRVSPDTSDIVYAGTEEGFYKSQDGGRTWVPKGLSGARVNDIAIDPRDSDTLYACTGRRYTHVDTVGVFKTTDGGDTWQPKWSYTGSLSLAVITLLLDSEDPSIVYAGKSSGYGLLRSPDGGDTWESRHIGSQLFRNDDVLALAMTTAGSTPPRLYASVSIPPTDSDLFVSLDSGDTWEALDAPYVSGALAVDPLHPLVVYIGSYRSADGGTTWSLKNEGLWGSPACFAIDPRDSAVVLAGLVSGGVFESTDGAESWHFASQGMINTNVKCLAVDPTSSHKVFAAISGIRLGMTTNGGGTWSYLLGSPPHLGAVSVDPQNPAKLIVGKAGAVGQGVLYAHRSINGGQTWTDQVLVGGIGAGSEIAVTDVWISPLDPSIALIAVQWWGSYGGGVYRSTNGGISYARTLAVWASSLASDLGDPQIVYLGSQRCGNVYRSPNGGANWANVSPGAPPGECWVDEVRDVAVDLNSDVYAATDSGLMRRSGSLWTRLTGLPTDDLTALALDTSTSPSTIYVGTGGEGVFVSEDGGGTWTPFSEGLESRSITTLAIGTDYAKILYAGTAYGGTWNRVLAPGNYVYLPVTMLHYGPPEAPTLHAIDNGDGDGSYIVRWSASATATEYTLQEDDDPSFGSPATVYAGPVTSTPIADRPNGTYYYRVKASNTLGSSAWSSVQSVVVSSGAQIYFVPHTVAENVDGARAVHAADLDTDGDVDILGAALYGDAITWWENGGGEQFAAHPITTDFDGAECAHAADVDGDGDLDVLGAAREGDAIVWWENDGSEQFTAHSIATDFDGANHVHGIDMDGDGDLDVVGAAFSAGTITWWENDGSEQFTAHPIATDFRGVEFAYVADLDGDGDLDVLAATPVLSDIAWWENDGSQGFGKHTISGDFLGAVAVHAADLDGDGDLDVLGAAAGDDQIAWWRNEGEGTFTPFVVGTGFDNAVSVYGVDLDGDGDVDILGASSLLPRISWWENDGNAQFVEHVITSSFDGAFSVDAADVDGDGDLDVLGAALYADAIAWWEQRSAAGTW